MTTPLQFSGICVCGKEDCATPFGLCHCGCGGKTPLASQGMRSRGWIAGMPTKFVGGHQGIKRPQIEDAKPFKIDGVYCRLIRLTRGQHAIVNATDYERLMQWTWSATWSKATRSFYAGRAVRKPDGRQTHVLMHREILGLKHGDQREVDHIRTGDTLDNRRANLRIATAAHNAQNRRNLVTNSSGVKGVHWSKQDSVWIGRIMTNGKRVVVARSKSLEVAKERMKIERRRQHGEFANAG